MFREGWEGGDCILTEEDSASVCRGYTINCIGRTVNLTQADGFSHTTHKDFVVAYSFLVQLQCLRARGVCTMNFTFISVSFRVNSLLLSINFTFMLVSFIVDYLFVFIIHEDPPVNRL